MPSTFIIFWGFNNGPNMCVRATEAAKFAPLNKRAGCTITQTHYKTNNGHQPALGFFPSAQRSPFYAPKTKIFIQGAL